MNVRYWVELSQAERGELTAMLSKGQGPVKAATGERRNSSRSWSRVWGPPHCALDRIAARGHASFAIK